jgi:plastocyanin
VPSGSPTSYATASPPSTQLATATVTIKDFAFGDPLTVKAGSTVTVHNADDTAHTVSAADGSFDTMPVFAGKSTAFVAPAKAGTYQFHCNIHANMEGMLVVTG